MKFPSPENKNLQYAACADILSDTITYLGEEVAHPTREVWRSAMHGLATADAIAEQSPDVFASEDNIVAFLEGPMAMDANEPAIVATRGLLRANEQSIKAQSLGEHLDSRREEAVLSTALLRSQAPELDDKPAVWSEVDKITIAGIYLDSLMDAREDSFRVAEFSAKELAAASLVRFTGAVRAIEPRARLALTKACLRNGLGGYVVRSIPRKLLA